MTRLPGCKESQFYGLPFGKVAASMTSPQGGYSGFQVTGMIEWSLKSRPKKIPRTSSKTQKNPWTKKSHADFAALKSSKRGNAITQRKTLEI